MANEETDELRISAEPTKSFFVEMFTKDIALEQAVLDLVDNCVDGAKRHQGKGDKPFDGKTVNITFNTEAFHIWDNCGGFDRQTARDYAFRFGRPKGKKLTPHSIGQFGVGMKRALFKFGGHFIVNAATAGEEWSVNVDVEQWMEREDDWTFAWEPFNPTKSISSQRPGTEILVDKLHPQVSRTFNTSVFENIIKSLIKSRHRNFLREGLNIIVNGESIVPVSLEICSADKIKPAVSRWTEKVGKIPVRISIITGVGPSTPKMAGWYVVCNGRLILDADRRDVTGWGVVEEYGDRKIVIPGYHNQFARFRGIVTFDSNDSGVVPWNTMKTDVDQDNPIWQNTREKMIELMRPVIDFLNELDADIEEYTRQYSPLHDIVEKAATFAPEKFRQSRDFLAPERTDAGPITRYTKIQYSREDKLVAEMKKLLGANSAKAVGEKTFDQVYERLKR